MYSEKTVLQMLPTGEVEEVISFYRREGVGRNVTLNILPDPFAAIGYLFFQKDLPPPPPKRKSKINNKLEACYISNVFFLLPFAKKNSCTIALLLEQQQMIKAERSFEKLGR